MDKKTLLLNSNAYLRNIQQNVNLIGDKHKIIQNSKEFLNSFKHKINKKIEELLEKEKNEIIESRIKPVSENLLMQFSDLTTRDSKRVRGAFIWFGYNLINKISTEHIQELLTASASIEFIHSGFLIHDDFMDKDELRRGGKTIHKLYEDYHVTRNLSGESKHFGHSMAINAGDLGLIFGIKTLQDTQFPSQRKSNAVKEMLDGMIQTIYGQSYDLELSAQASVQVEENIMLNIAKTAIYTFRTPILIGLKLAGESVEVEKAMSEYSKNAGIAFQIKDDILGLFGESDKTGKSVYSDLVEGKKTILTIKALELCSNEEKKQLYTVLGNKNAEIHQLEKSKLIIRKSGALDYALETCKMHSSCAINALNVIANKVDDQMLSFFKGIALYLGQVRVT